MKDFAKSIHVGNATIKFYGETIDLTKKSESDLKEILEEFQMMHEGADEQRAIKEELKKRKTGNSKVGNAIKKFGMGSLVIADGHKAVVFKETVEQGPNGIPFGWVTVRFVEGPWKGQTDEYYDYDLKKA